jgi:hypothetical protein
MDTSPAASVTQPAVFLVEIAQSHKLRPPLRTTAWPYALCSRPVYPLVPYPRRTAVQAS